MKNQRIIMILIVLLVFGVFLGTLVMSQPPFPEEPPWYISIDGLDDFSLTSPTAMGTYSGSDLFTVGVNNETGATVISSVSDFTPALTNTATASVSPTDILQGATDCTVTVQVEIVLLDAPGTHQAILTITVINNP